MAKRDPRILILFYEDLIHDLRKEMDKVKKHCNIKISEDKYEVALSRMSFDYMKVNEKLFTPVSVRWKVPYQFIRKGKIGDHQTLFQQEVRKVDNTGRNGNDEIIKTNTGTSLNHYDLFQEMIKVTFTL